MLNHSPFILQKYQIYNEMNHGRYAIVHRALDLETGVEVAIKIINKDVLVEKELSPEYLENEKIIFRILNNHDEVEVGSKNVIKLYDYHVFEDIEYIIMELINGYDMQREVFERFNIKNRKKYTLERSIDIMLQLIDGVRYLHSRNIYHCDLKPENIMIGDDKVVIVDFGCAVFVKSGRDIANKFYMMGTVGFSPPEIVDMEILDKEIELAKIDVWAMCCSFYYLFEGKLPFRDENFNDLRYNEHIVALHYDKECSEKVLRICEKVFVYENEKRLGVEEFRDEILKLKECN